MRTPLTPLAVSFGALLVLAAPAVAAPSGAPLRSWSVRRIDQGTGGVEVDHGTRLGGAVSRTIDLGPVAFNFRGTPSFDRASGLVASSASGRSYAVAATAPSRDPSQPHSPKGGAAHLDEYQAYVKRSERASLKITLSDARLTTVDADAGLADCGISCRPVRSIVRFHARAYAASADGDFYDVGGAAYLEGRHGHWAFKVASTSGAGARGWTKANFDDDPDFAGDIPSGPTGSGADLFLHRPVTLKVPLASVHEGELFAVHVSLDAEAADDIGLETAAQAFIKDPQELLAPRGLKARGAPRFREPASRAPRPARCPHGPARKAGTLQLGDAAFAADESERSPLVLVTRRGGAHRAASVRLTTRGGTAAAGADYRSTSTTVRFPAGDRTPRLVAIPLREDEAVEPAETFTVALSHARCARLGARRSAAVTIADDDAAPPPPPPPPAPAPAAPAAATPAPAPAALPSAPDAALISTPVGDGAGEAVVIQPDGGIVTAGHRGPFTAQDFALTRHDAAGRLDPGFGDHGIAATDVGGDDDEAFAAAATPGGGIVAAGRTDVAGAGNSDFAVVRYRPDGTPDPEFGDHGIVTLDVAGGPDQANAVAVQRDGTIVVAGTGTTRPGDTDAVLALYTPAGEKERVVTQDLGTRSDAANALAVDDDGRILVAGTAGEDVALARFTEVGDPDTTFGRGGMTITDLGFDDVADDVALAPDGAILVAGSTLGARLDEDFLLLRYDGDGELDTAFGDHGAVRTDFGHGHDLAHGLAVDGQGRIVLAGSASSATILDMALARYRPDGALDTTRTADFRGRGDIAADVALDADGRIVAAGETANGAESEFALWRIAGAALTP